MPRTIYEYQIQPIDGGFDLVITRSVGDNYWSSKCRLNSTNWEDAGKEAKTKVAALATALRTD